MAEISVVQTLRNIVDEVRWNIIHILGTGDYRVSELTKHIGQPQNLVSYHLKKLRDLHLVNERRSSADARDVYYSLDLAQVQALYAAAGRALHPALVQHMPPSPSLPIIKPIHVLFLCTGNSARSQIAEGLLRTMGSAAVQVLSAGTNPAGVHPNAIRVMSERGIDISGQQSKAIEAVADQSFDYVITVCDRAREVCPTFPGQAQFIHWSLPDPKLVADPDAQYHAFQQTADQLATRIHYFLARVAAEQENVT